MREIKAKYNGTCKTCGKEIKIADPIANVNGVWVCLECAEKFVPEPEPECKFEPFYRVSFRPQIRDSYCDPTRSRTFKTEAEAIEFAETLKGMYRDVIYAYGEKKVYDAIVLKYKTIAKWGRKTVNGKKVIGRIK